MKIYIISIWVQYHLLSLVHRLHPDVDARQQIKKKHYITLLSLKFYETVSIFVSY